MSNNPAIMKLQDTLKLEPNSILDVVRTKDDNGNTITYSLKTIYKLGNRYDMAIIESNCGIEALINIKSLKDLINKGYIDNAVLTLDGKGIKQHTNKLKVHKELKKFNVVTIYSSSVYHINKVANELEAKFAYIIDVDNSVENISKQRLNVYGFVFDLSGNIMAVLVKNEFEDTVVSINDYIKMSSAEYNKGNFSPRSEANNSFRALPYIRIDKSKYNKIQSKLSVTSKKGISESKNFFTKNINFMTIELSLMLYGSENTFFAIPKPEMFSTPDVFQSSINYANYLEETTYNSKNYMLMEYNTVPVYSFKSTLLKCYDILNTGEYIDEYGDITKCLISLEHDKKMDEEDRLIENLLRLIDLAEQGIDITDSFEQLNFMVIDADKFNELSEKKQQDLIQRFLCNTVNKSIIDKYMRPATLTEALDVFNIPISNYHLFESKYNDNKDISDETQTEYCINSDKESFKQLIDVAYIVNDGSARVEVIRERKSVYVRLINERTDDKIVIEKSVISYSDYINYGLSKEAIIGSLNRMLNGLGNHNNIEDILDEIEAN